MDELLDLLAGEVAAAGQLAEHALAVGAGLLDHLAALLLGHRQLGLGVGGGVAAPAGGLQLGLLADPPGLVAGLAQQLGGAVLGPAADRRAALAGGLQDARRLLAEQARRRLVVERQPSVDDRAGLGGAQLALEEPLALLQAGQLGGDHAQEVADLLLVEAAPRGAERRVGHAGRGRRIGARERDGHGAKRKRGAPRRSRQSAAAVRGAAGRRRGARSAASASSSVATGMISTSSPAISRARAMSSSLCDAGTRNVLHAGLAHGRRLLRQAADGADRAVELDRARDRDVGAAGQVARRQLVDQRQRERQPGRRPADAVGVDVDLERQVDASPCRTGRSPTIVRAGSSGDVVSSTSTVRSPRLGSARSRAATVSPGCLPASAATRSSTVSSGTPSMRSSVSPGSSTAAAGAGVVHVPSAASSRHTRSATTTLPGLIVASSKPSALQGDVLGDLARRAHHLQRDAALLGAAARRVQLVVGVEVDLRLGAALGDDVAAVDRRRPTTTATDCVGLEIVTK